MKQWLESREVLDRLAGLLLVGKGAALATVVRVRGSAYRREGAKLLVTEDGTTVGNVSGGCLEGDVREVGLAVIASGHATVRSYCAGSDEIAAWDLGLGCDGAVEVLVESVTSARTGERALLDGTDPFAACALIDAPDRRMVVTAGGCEGVLVEPAFDTSVADIARSVMSAGASAIHRIDGRDVFIDAYAPPPRLVIFSAGDDARPLARYAAEIGFRVVVVDHRPAMLTRDRFPLVHRLLMAGPDTLPEALELGADAFAVVMTHGYDRDREYVRMLLATDVAYVGLLGPRQRRDRILAELATVGVVDEGRVFGPLGLDIGTDGAEQIAISALSEILSVRSGRGASSLRDRAGPVHTDVRD